MPRPAKVFYGWWVVGASVIGTALCQSPIVFLTLGVFMIPLGEQFGWDRAEISLGLSVAAFSLAVATPFVGRLLDRFGPRKILLSSLLLYGATTASLGALGKAIWQFYLTLAAIGVLGAGSNTMSYARVLTAWFDKRRGFALGMTMAGIALGTTVAPVYAQAMIDAFDWRMAYTGLGLTVIVLGMPVIYFVIKETPQELGLQPDGVEQTSEVNAPGVSGEPPPAAGGMTRAQAFRSRTFWMLLAIFFMLAVALHGVQIHLVPLLRDAGITPRFAAAMAGLMGLTSMFGRVLVGYLFDRIFAPRVAIVTFLCTGLGFVLLTVTESLPMAVICTVLMGIGASSESDLLAYLCSRYFGLASFGELYGYVYAALMLGTAIGPYAVGLSFELSGSYTTALWYCFGGSLLICWLLSRLEAFPR